MARKVDITVKLTFEENPALIIRGEEIEVNADAPTMLKIMNFMTEDGVGINQINEAYELIFPEKSRQAIEDMRLSVPDWMTVVQEAMSLVTGEDIAPGEQ